MAAPQSLNFGILNGYTLVNENMDYGVKLYSKTINGVPTKDFILVFYNDGVVTSIEKSAYNLTEADKLQAIQKYGKLAEANRKLLNDVSRPNQLSYALVNGQLELVKEVTVETQESGVVYRDLKFESVASRRIVL